MGLRFVFIFLLGLYSSAALSMDCPNGFEMFQPLMMAKADAADAECIALLLQLKVMQTLTCILITQATFLSNPQSYGYDAFSDDFVDGLFNHLFLDMACIDAALYNFGEVGDKVFPVQFMVNIFVLLQKVFYVCHLDKEFNRLKMVKSKEYACNPEDSLYVSLHLCARYVGVFLENLWEIFHKNFDFSYLGPSMVCFRIILNGLEQRIAAAREDVLERRAVQPYYHFRVNSFEDVTDAFICMTPLLNLKWTLRHLFNVYKNDRIEFLSCSPFIVAKEK